MTQRSRGSTLVRTLVLLAGSIVVFGGAYFAASVALPDPDRLASSEKRDLQLTLPQTTAPGEGVGPSEGVSFRLFDPKTNLPTAQVVIGRYRRTGERTVELQDVTISIVVQGGAAVTIRSPLGNVRVEPPASGGAQQIDADALAAADQARLTDVVLRWYADATDLQRGRPETLRADVENIVFDHTRFTLATADTTIDGRTVLADDVPVRVRSPDYDFDGYGLFAEWDPTARQPTLVRISRGDRLVIKTEPAFLPGGLAPAEARGPVSPHQMLASTSALAAAAAVQEPTVEVTPYTIQLADTVRVHQGDQTLLEADTAQAVVALAKQQVDALRAGPVAPAEPGTDPTASQPVVPPVSAPAPQPSASPAKPEFVPIVVNWQGELRLQPAGEEVRLAGEDDARLRLVGSPLVARFDGSEVRGETLDYDQSADEMILRAKQGTDVTLVDAKGNTLVTPVLRAAPDAGTARAEGAGFAELAGEDATAQPTRLTWGETCDFTFDQTAGDGEQQQAILRHIDAAGGVVVRDPSLHLTADRLSLDLDPPAGEGSPVLTSVTAEGSVHCVLDSDEEPAVFDAGRLWLTMPDGPTGEVTAEADGGVVTQRPDGRLQGQRLRAQLKPDAEGQLELASLQVEEDVVATDAEGRTLRGALATIDGPDRPLVVSGAEQPARVNLQTDAAEAQVVSQTVVLNPEDESLSVPTAGVLDVIQQTDAGPRQRRVTWDSGFVATGQRVDVAGNVTITGDPADPAALRMTSDAAVVLLREQTDQKQPADDEDESLEQIEEVQLTGSVRLGVEELGPDGNLLRSMDLRSAAATASPATQAFSVPGAGRSLYRDLRPKAVEGSEEEDEALAGFRGNAALAWQNRLDYDPEAELLSMTGGATAVLEPEDAPALRMTADRFDVAVQRAAEVDAQPEFGGATATGSVRVEGDAMVFEAGVVVYDPATNTLTARGREKGGVVRLFDRDGLPKGQFRELVYNVATGRIDRLTDLQAGG